METGAAHYEFDAGQNDLIAGLAKKMTWVAYFMFALAILSAIAGVMTLAEDGVGTIIQAVLLMIVALWTKKAAEAFQRIVQTEGTDVSNLMTALGELKKLYTLQFWVMIVAVVLIGIALVIGFAAVTAGALS